MDPLENWCIFLARSEGALGFGNDREDARQSFQIGDDVAGRTPEEIAPGQKGKAGLHECRPMRRATSRACRSNCSGVRTKCSNTGPCRSSRRTPNLASPGAPRRSGSRASRTAAGRTSPDKAFDDRPRRVHPRRRSATKPLEGFDCSTATPCRRRLLPAQAAGVKLADQAQGNLANLGIECPKTLPRPAFSASRQGSPPGARDRWSGLSCPGP